MSSLRECRFSPPAVPSFTCFEKCSAPPLAKEKSFFLSHPCPCFCLAFALAFASSSFLLLSRHRSRQFRPVLSRHVQLAPRIVSFRSVLTRKFRATIRRSSRRTRFRFAGMSSPVSSCSRFQHSCPPVPNHFSRPHPRSKTIRTVAKRSRKGLKVLWRE